MPCQGIPLEPLLKGVDYLIIRNRSKQLLIRLTPEEFAYFQICYRNSKFGSQSDYLLKLIQTTDNDLIRTENVIRETLLELRKEGTNLNQIARVMNQSGLVSNEIEDVLSNLDLAYQNLMRLELRKYAI